MNELALIFKKMDISIYDVLKAAGTKWNFLKFYPGLVGGHCIGVDPYYLTYRAQELGYTSEVILAGRRINDSMGAWIAEQTMEKLQMEKVDYKQAKVLVCGITFKENVPDVRNSKVVTIIRRLELAGVVPVVIDPIADPGEVEHEYNITLGDDTKQTFDCVILAVAHDDFRNRTVEEWKKILKPNGLIVDVKGLLNSQEVEKSGLTYWGL